MGSRTSLARVRRVALSLLAAAVIAGCSHSATSTSTPNRVLHPFLEGPASRAAMAGGPVDPAWTPIDSPPTNGLASNPWMGPQMPGVQQSTRFFTADETIEAVANWLKAHVPSGYKLIDLNNFTQGPTAPHQEAVFEKIVASKPSNRAEVVYKLDLMSLQSTGIRVDALDGPKTQDFFES